MSSQLLQAIGSSARKTWSCLLYLATLIAHWGTRSCLSQMAFAAHLQSFPCHHWMQRYAEAFSATCLRFTPANRRIIGQLQTLEITDIAKSLGLCDFSESARLGRGYRVPVARLFSRQCGSIKTLKVSPVDPELPSHQPLILASWSEVAGSSATIELRQRGEGVHVGSSWIGAEALWQARRSGFSSTAAPSSIFHAQRAGTEQGPPMLCV